MFLDCARLIANNTPRVAGGVAVVDLDGDGRFEIVVAGNGSANSVLKWQDGALVDIADPLIADPAGNAVGVAAADVDGDGREELYIVNSNQSSGPKEMADRLFACFGDSWFDLLSQGQNAGTANRSAAYSVAVIDRLGTGRYGFVVATDGAPLRLFELNRRGRVEDVAEEAGVDLIAAGRGLLSMSFLSDRMDLFVCNESGANALYRNLGDGCFEEIAEERGVADSRVASRAVVALDVDGDGALALAIAGWDAPQRLFLLRPDGSFEDAATSEFSWPGRIGTVVAADFDNDGRVELFFAAHNGPNRLFARGDEGWYEAEIGDAAEPRGAPAGVGVVDIDGDGQLELLIAHQDASAQPLSLYRPSPNTNSWLRVQPLTRFGAPARGAVVTCLAGGRRQRRAICAGSGHLSQMEPVAHFGLGSLREVERIEVRWPDGTEAIVSAPSVEQVLIVPYPPA